MVECDSFLCVKYRSIEKIYYILHDTVNFRTCLVNLFKIIVPNFLSLMGNGIHDEMKQFDNLFMF